MYVYVQMKGVKDTVDLELTSQEKLDLVSTSM